MIKINFSTKSIYIKVILFLFICIFFCISTAHSQNILDLADDVKTDDKKSKKVDFTIGGYLKSWAIMKKFNELQYSGVDEAKWNNRLQLKLEGHFSKWGHFYSAFNFGIGVDFMNTGSKNYEDIMGFELEQFTLDKGMVATQGFITEFEIQECYFDWYAADWLSIRIGRHYIIWGEIEGIEAPTDIITPRDYNTESLSFEDSRIAPTGVLMSFHFLRQKIDLVWLPFFQPHEIPYVDILAKGDTEFATVVPKLKRTPIGIENGEYAFRITGDISFFRYGVGFLYGFDDLPDSEISYIKNSNLPDQSTVVVDLVYKRLIVPTVDLAFNVKDKVTIKGVSAFYITEDLDGKVDEYKNSTIKYLAGVETTNIFWDIYFSFYMGQKWIKNYTEEHGYINSGDNNIYPNELQNRDMLVGFDQIYPFKWLISNTCQRSFLSGNSLTLLITYALSIAPDFTELDYTVNLKLENTFSNGISLRFGLVLTEVVDIIKNYGILEFKYVF